MPSTTPSRGAAAPTQRRRPTWGQTVAVLAVAAAVGVLPRVAEGAGFWPVVLLGVVGAIGCVITFDSTRGWVQTLFGIVAFLVSAAFVLQVAVSLVA